MTESRLLTARANFQLREILAEPCEQLRYEIFCRTDHRQVDAATAQPLETVERILRIFQIAQNLARAGEQLLTRLGHEQAAADALEQGQPGIRLQFLDVHRNARLREMQNLSSFRERARGRRGLEHPQLPQRNALNGHRRPPSAKPYLKYEHN